MKKLRLNKDMYFRENGESIQLILMDQTDDEFFELDGLAAWIIRDALPVPVTREELHEFAVEDFEDLPENYVKEINAVLDELISHNFVIEEDS